MSANKEKKNANRAHAVAAWEWFKEAAWLQVLLIVGVVGVLQFEVLEYRLKTEYGVDIRRRSMPYEFVRWVENEDINIANLYNQSRANYAYTLIDLEKRITDEALEKIHAIDGMVRVRIVN